MMSMSNCFLLKISRSRADESVQLTVFGTDPIRIHLIAPCPTCCSTFTGECHFLSKCTICTLHLLNVQLNTWTLMRNRKGALGFTHRERSSFQVLIRMTCFLSSSRVPNLVLFSLLTCPVPPGPLNGLFPD